MSEKKGATRQSFIRKEITTYRIGTLVMLLQLYTLFLCSAYQQQTFHEFIIDRQKKLCLRYNFM